MDNFVKSFEDFGHPINEGDAGSNIVLDSDKAIITLLDNEPAFQAALSELNVFDFQDTDDLFADMYYTQLITPYFVELKNDYAAQVPFRGIVDFQSNQIKGKYNSRISQTELNDYFNRLINATEESSIGIKEGDKITSMTSFSDSGGEYDFKAGFEDEIQEPLDVQELTTIKGSLIDMSSNKFFIFVTKNGKKKITTGMQFARLGNGGYAAGGSNSFIFTDNIKRIFN